MTPPPDTTSLARSRRFAGSLRLPVQGSKPYELCCAQLQGHSVCVVERRRVQGRVQEWNISRGELAALTRLGLLSEAELETTIVSEWVRSRIERGLSCRFRVWVGPGAAAGAKIRARARARAGPGVAFGAGVGAGVGESQGSGFLQLTRLGQSARRSWKQPS